MIARQVFRKIFAICAIYLALALMVLCAFTRVYEGVVCNVGRQFLYAHVI